MRAGPNAGQGKGMSVLCGTGLLWVHTRVHTRGTPLVHTRAAPGVLHTHACLRHDHVLKVRTVFGSQPSSLCALVVCARHSSVPYARLPRYSQHARCTHALVHHADYRTTHHLRLTFLLISAATSSGSSAGWPTEDTVAAQLRYSSEPSALRTLVQDSAWGGGRAGNGEGGCQG